MVWSALLLSRLQFAFTVSFLIIFPSFTIGLASTTVGCRRPSAMRSKMASSFQRIGRRSFLAPVVWVRFPHMLVAAYLTGAFCVAATGAWHRLRGTYALEGMLMLRMGLFLAAFVIPVQLFLGHLNGD
jgi:cytochrome bd-type quinol oxidase subunit 1